MAGGRPLGRPLYSDEMMRPRLLLVVAAASTALFAILLLAVIVHRGPLPLDGPVRDWFASVSSPTSRDLVVPMARLGAREILVPLLLIGGGILCWRSRSPGPLVLLVASYVGMAMVVGPAKKLLHRPEPFDLPGEIGRSFPSGHAAQAVLVYGLLAALVASGSLGPRGRAAVTLLALAASTAVGLAMLIRGAHWLSDMVAGYAIGLAWTAGPLAVAHLAAPWLLGSTTGDPSGPEPAAAARRR